jgi:pantoate--beta-alanine ligase
VRRAQLAAALDVSAAAFSDRLEAARRAGHTVGLVPTMGALHAGHRSLVERAAAECTHVAVTVFVNPLQFNNPDDLRAYPRTIEADLAVCADAGAASVFAPGVSEMYPAWPDPPATTVTVGGPSAGWEGASRPGHFAGVATVVAKLFSLAGPCRAYFGEKDFQQLAVVRRMTADLSIPVQIVGCPTVREPDGLALSSRNVRLSAPQRRAAPVLYRALLAGRSAVAAGERSPEAVSRAMSAVVADEPLVELDYAAVVDAADLCTPVALEPAMTLRLLIAAQVGPVRLIDNCDAPPPGRPPAGTAANSAPARAAAAGPTDGWT